jgi:hypothetical protein
MRLLRFRLPGCTGCREKCPQQMLKMKEGLFSGSDLRQYLEWLRRVRMAREMGIPRAGKGDQRRAAGFY